jgi:hypothetical protein
MGGRIDCPDCNDYLTPDEVTAGRSLACPGCAPTDAGGDDGGPQEAEPAGADPQVARSGLRERLAGLWGAPLPQPA